MTISRNRAAVLAYHRLQAALERFGRPPSALTAPERAVVEEQATRRYAVEERVVRTPEAAGVAITEQALDTALETIGARYADGTQFQADLADNGLSVAALRTALRRQMTVEAVLDEVSAHAARVNDLNVALYYRTNRDRFTRPETRTARHILITINQDFPDNTPEEARRRLDSIRQCLASRPDRFAEQAIEHSECPTALRGGLIGRLQRGRLFEALDAVLFELHEGELSAIVESPVGLHLLLCEKIHPAGLMPLAEARPKILKELRRIEGEKRDLTPPHLTPKTDCSG